MRRRSDQAAYVTGSSARGWSGGRYSSEFREWWGAAGRFGAGDQVVAACGHRGLQRVTDDTQVDDLLFGLSELGRRAGVQPSVIAAVPVGSGDEELRDLAEGESESLCGLYHPYHSHRLRRI